MITSEHISKREENLKLLLVKTGGPSSPREEGKARVDLDTGLVLHCPDCGAPIERNQEDCSYCHAPLDFSLKGKTKICPDCYHNIAADSRFCTHCGRIVKDFMAEGQIREDRFCPRCEIPMQGKGIGQFVVTGCDHCDGLFVPIETFEMMQDTMDRTVFPADGVRNGPLKWENTISYVKCPICKKTMARTNFARTSGILIDLCRGHGIWFDSEELQAVMQFISMNRQAVNFVDALHLKGNCLEDGLIGMLKNGQAEKKAVSIRSLESSDSLGGLGGFVLTEIMVNSSRGKGRHECPACHTFHAEPFKRCPECGYVLKWQENT